MKKVLIIIILSFMLFGCGLPLDSKEERDKAIEDCKNNGGTPYVKNYSDSRLRPIVDCVFEN